MILLLASALLLSLGTWVIRRTRVYDIDVVLGWIALPIGAMLFFAGLVSVFES